MQDTLILEIVTPEKIAYTNSVSMVSVPGVMGRMGILPKHIPLFALLTEGEVKITKGDNVVFLSIGGGFVEVTHEKVMVLVTRAVNAQELNEQEIIKAKKDAQEALKQKPTGKELAKVQAVYRQSLVDLQILRRRRRVH